MIGRRGFISAVAGVHLAIPHATTAQPVGKVPRIGWLGFNAPETAPHQDAAFRQGLHDHGWIEGSNILIEYRSAGGRADRLPALAAELVRLDVDLLVTAFSASTRAAKDAATKIPIVMAASANAPAEGLAAACTYRIVFGPRAGPEGVDRAGGDAERVGLRTVGLRVSLTRTRVLRRLLAIRHAPPQSHQLERSLARSTDMKLAWTLALCLLVAGGAVAAHDQLDEGPSVRALAKISGCTDPGISGMARLLERGSPEGVKLVDIAIKVRGLSDGKHAVHIHAAGACHPCSAALGHFDPGPFGNSSPDGNHPYHSGDLVNIDVKNGRGVLRTTTSRVTLSPGPLSLFDADGSAFIIHVNPDTYCPNGEVAGCAGGARAACGVIERVTAEADDWFD